MRAWWGVNPPPEGWFDQPYGWHEKTITTTTTTTTVPPAQPTVDEEGARRIVREEIADIMPVDVPDAPPEDLD